MVAAADRSRRSEALAKKRDRAIEGVFRGMTFLVDEVNREHRVCVMGNPERIAVRRVDLDRFETIAEFRAQAIEPLERAGSVLRETKAEHGYVAAPGSGKVFI
jgi:hypothetical protein